MKIQITLTKDQYEFLIEELISLDRIAGLEVNDDGFSILAIVETQNEEVPD